MNDMMVAPHHLRLQGVITCEARDGMSFIIVQQEVFMKKVILLLNRVKVVMVVPYTPHCVKSIHE